MKIPFLVLAVLFAVGLTACGDNPVDDDDHDEHAEAHGLEVQLGDAVVYRVLEHVVSCDVEPCGITVAAGSETAVMTVEFLDEDGDHIHDEDLDEDFSLDFEIADGSVATVEQEGDWSFRIGGESVGETEFVLKLIHLEQHEDFTSPPLGEPGAITIRVTDAE